MASNRPTLGQGDLLGSKGTARAGLSAESPLRDEGVVRAPQLGEVRFESATLFEQRAARELSRLPGRGLEALQAASLWPASHLLTRLYASERSLLTWQMENFPTHFPHDRWIVDAT